MPDLLFQSGNGEGGDKIIFVQPEKIAFLKINTPTTVLPIAVAAPEPLAAFTTCLLKSADVPKKRKSFPTEKLQQRRAVDPKTVIYTFGTPVSDDSAGSGRIAGSCGVNVKKDAR